MDSLPFPFAVRVRQSIVFSCCFSLTFPPHFVLEMAQFKGKKGFEVILFFGGDEEFFYCASHVVCGVVECCLWSIYENFEIFH
jgi:hypothetical protein